MKLTAFSAPAKAGGKTSVRLSNGPGAAALALLLAATLAGGCATLPSVGPDYAPPKVPLPDAWHTDVSTPQDLPPPTPAAQRLADWWRQLGDPQLDRLIDTALADNLDLKLAQARLRQARASREQAVGGYYPTVTTSAGASRTKASTGGQAGLPETSAQSMYNVGFDASWELDLFGGTRRAVEAATADLQASQANLDDARVSLVAEVAQNYVDLRSYQQRLAIARANLESQTETERITDWRAQAGLDSASDVERARTTLEQTRASIPDLDIGLVAAKNRLAVLLGLHPGELDARLAEVRPLPAAPAGIASGIPAQVLRQRPDLLAAERTLAAETARVGQKLAQRFPSLSLSGTLGWQAATLGGLGATGSLLNSIAGTLAATLFDGGRLRSAVEIQSAVQEQALVSYEQSVLTALEEVENALREFASSEERTTARRAAAESALRAADLTRSMYASGLSDFEEVLDTERTRLTAENDLAQAEATRLQSLIKLYKALGGGWQPASGQQEHTAS